MFNQLYDAGWYLLPENARTSPTSAVEKLNPPFFLGLTAHNEKICGQKITSLWSSMFVNEYKLLRKEKSPKGKYALGERA